MKNLRSKTVFTLFLLLSVFSKNFACDDSTITITSNTDNGDGTTTFCLDLTTELGSLDASYYGFVLQFLSASGTPIPVAGTYPATVGPTGSLVEVLTATTGSLVNSIVNDSDWNEYENMDNVISYEWGGIFGAASNDFSLSLCVTITGCVESILFDASANSGATACEISASTGIACPIVSPCDCTNPVCTGTHFDCSSDAEAAFNDPFATGYLLTPPISVANGSVVELCWDYTTGPAETTIGFVTQTAYQEACPGCCDFDRTYHVYEAGCATELSSDGPSDFGTGFEYTVMPNTTYTFCNEMTITTSDCEEVAENFLWLYDAAGGSSCGTCAIPDCPIGEVPTYDDRTYSTCWIPSCPVVGDAIVTNCFEATADCCGFLGFANIINDGSPFCFPGDIDITWELQESGNCGTVIPNPFPNVNNVQSGFNPEYDGLTPNADYVLCVTYDVPAIFDCSLVEVCVDTYGATPTCGGSCPTTTMPCEDGDPCTTGETITTLDCNADVCVPCSGGVPVSCATGGPSTTLPCDDGDPCTTG